MTTGLRLLMIAVGSAGLLSAEVQAAAPPIYATDLFEFFSEPDIAQHHFLYNWARLDTIRNPRFAVTERGETDRLTKEEREAWLAAVSSYREKFAARSLLFDEEMVRLRDGLAAGQKPQGPLAEEAGQILGRVRSIYRNYWWSRHDERNRQWVEDVLPRLRALEKEMAKRIAAAYGGVWPPGRIRVDVTPYADDVGAYTTGKPHITISSSNAATFMPWAFEMLFHEASHADSLEGALNRQIAAAYPAKPPADLWHQMIFFTAGEVTRQVLLGVGVKDYRTYAETTGMYRRIAEWGRQRDALVKHWKPVLEGTVSREEGLKRLAESR